MTEKPAFLLEDFLPYLLNRAAEVTSLTFQHYYKAKYGMLRTEWRVLFHLGRFGDLTAKSICQQADIHKTKVSRAVSALEQRRFLKRVTLEEDRRHEVLSLTPNGVAAFEDLVEEAERYQETLLAQSSPEEIAIVRGFLRRMGAMDKA